MSTRDIQAELNELYGVDVSPSMISNITDKVLGSASEYQNRMLDEVYPIVYMDTIHFKVRDEHRIVTKAAYICLGIDMDGIKDILGIWIGESEGAKFWLSVCKDLSNRGVKDICIACMDGLKGLPEAIKTVFPNVSIQNCIIRQIRNSMKYVPYKDRKAFVTDLKKIYKAPTEEIALAQLDMLKDKWNDKYSNVINSWYVNWDKLSTFFVFNEQIRKFTKTRTVFTTDDSLRKSLYLATEIIMQKWTSLIPNWGLILSQFMIMFGDRLDKNEVI